MDFASDCCAGDCSFRFGRGLVGLASVRAVVAAFIGAVALSACSTSGTAPVSNAGLAHDPTENFSVAKYGPATTKVAAVGAPIPKGGGHYMVGEPYRIAGKTYIPREDPKYAQVGVASWYGADFHGRETANGEIYDLDAVTAAHPTMPLPSYARVTNLDNGRSMTVRVNDRGPFVDSRIIDVSRTVARMLDFEDEGTAKVKVEYVGPATLDGNDEKMLLASYRGPGVAPANVVNFPVRVATREPQPLAPATAPVAAPTSRSAQQAPTLTVASTAAAPAARPAATNAPAATTSLSRSTLVSYAAPQSPTPAEEAAATLGRSDLSEQLKLAAAKKAAELGLKGPALP